MQDIQQPHDPAAALVGGSRYPKETRETFRKANPILDQLAAEHPGIDRLYLLFLLREQVRVAIEWPDRRLRRAWKKLFMAWDTFQARGWAHLGGFSPPDRSLPTLANLAGIFATQKKISKAEGMVFTEATTPEELWEQRDRPFKKVQEGLDQIQRFFSLPAYTEKKGGRPTAWWSDAVVFAMKWHLENRTGAPKWSMIERLLSCAPNIPGISMRLDHPRRRIDRWRRKGGFDWESLELWADKLSDNYQDWRSTAINT